MNDDLRALMADLDDAKVDLSEVRGVVQKGAQNVKTAWQRNARGIAHAPRYPASIHYDIGVTAGGVYGEIGPDDSGGNQGFLGRVLELGGAHNAPGNYGDRAAGEEEPRFVEAIGKLGEIL